MIGVIADSAEQNVVSEFFELFKTPWEFYREDRQYDVVLCVGESQFDGTAKVVLLYAGRKTHFDDGEEGHTVCQQKQCILSYQGNRIPIYGESVTFQERESGFLADEDSRQCAAYLGRSARTIAGPDWL